MSNSSINNNSNDYQKQEGRKEVSGASISSSIYLFDLALFAAGSFILMSFASAPAMLTNTAFAQEGDNNTSAAVNMTSITTTTTADNLLYEETGNTMGNEIIAIANNLAVVEVAYNAGGDYNGTAVGDLATATYTISSGGQRSGSGKVMLISTSNSDLTSIGSIF